MLLAGICHGRIGGSLDMFHDDGTRCHRDGEWPAAQLPRTGFSQLFLAEESAPGRIS